jgi:hypothetical protein
MAGSLSDGEDLSDDEQVCITVDFLRFKSLDVLKAFKKAIPRDIRDEKGRTLLHWAAARGQVAKAKFLVESGLVTPEAVNAQGETAMEIASRVGFVEVMEHLASLGLVCKLRDARNQLNRDTNLQIESQLSAAIYADNVEVIELVWNAYVQNPQGRFSLSEHFEWTPLTLAATFLSPQAMEFLIYRGCSLIEPSWDSGYTPIRTVLTTFSKHIPPETDQDWTMVNAGSRCLGLLLHLQIDLSDYAKLLGTLKTQLRLVGVYEVAASPFEREVERRVDALRLALSELPY